MAIMTCSSFIPVVTGRGPQDPFAHFIFPTSSRTSLRVRPDGESFTDYKWSLQPAQLSSILVERYSVLSPDRPNFENPQHRVKT
jgi:hypothetical protein